MESQMWKRLKAIWMEFVLHDQASVTRGALCVFRSTSVCCLTYREFLQCTV